MTASKQTTTASPTPERAVPYHAYNDDEHAVMLLHIGGGGAGEHACRQEGARRKAGKALELAHRRASFCLRPRRGCGR